MRLNQVHIADVRALKTLSDLSTVLISIDALHYFGITSFQKLLSISPLNDGDLICILNSVAEYLMVDRTTVFWGILQNQSVESWPVDRLQVNSDQPNNCRSYDVEFSNGHSARIRFLMNGDDISIRFDQQLTSSVHSISVGCQIVFMVRLLNNLHLLMYPFKLLDPIWGDYRSLRID